MPDGWLTARQIAEKFGVGPSNACPRIITPLLRAGKAEVRNFRVAVTGGFIRALPHYRLKT